MTQTEAAEAKEKKKLNIKIVYNREHPFHPEADALVSAVREEAMDFFKIVADRDTLRLFRADNTELEESREIGSYDLEKGEVLVLRQPQGGG